MHTLCSLVSSYWREAKFPISSFVVILHPFRPTLIVPILPAIFSCHYPHSYKPGKPWTSLPANLVVFLLFQDGEVWSVKIWRSGQGCQLPKDMGDPLSAKVLLVFRLQSVPQVNVPVKLPYMQAPRPAGDARVHVHTGEDLLRSES